MKKTCKKTLSLILSLLMVISILSLTGTDFSLTTKAVNTNKYKIGDIIEFGSYPQSKVSDSSLIEKLNDIETEMISYGYYISGSKSDFMKYGDVVYKNEMYRKVVFSEYRPYWNKNPSSYTEQKNNGYYTNTVYWFKFDPIKWTVLDADEGLVFSNMILDSRYFHDVDRYPTWEKSSIRSWLNSDFYNYAFSAEEKEHIMLSNISTHNYNGISGGTDTKDNIFLLSYNEVLNTEYGFSSNYSDKDVQRRKLGTEYAKCQGLWQNNNYGDWWLRTPGNDSSCAKIIDWDGAVNIYNNVNATSVTSVGVCPALKIDFNSIPTTKTLSKITIDSMPTKTTYAIGESFDKTGLAVTAHYSDGSSKTISSYNISGFDSSTAGSKTLTVKYTEDGITKTCTFKITVHEEKSPTLSASDYNIDIDTNSYEDIVFSCNTEGTNITSIVIGYQIENDDIVSAKWLGWDGWDDTLRITAKETGTTNITVYIYNPDTNKTYDSVVVTVNVTNSLPTLSLEKETVTVNAGSYVDVISTCHINGYRYEIEMAINDENSTIAEGSWLEWDEWDLPVRIYGNSAGITTVTLILRDAKTGQVFDTEEIEVEVIDPGYSFWEWLIIIFLFGWIWYV